jgi:hypothetical protein
VVTTIYRDYQRDRIGWFFGLSGWQLIVLAGTVLPVFWAVHAGAWTSAVLFLAVWAVVVLVTTVPVRGRSALGWLAASAALLTGRAAGWTRYRNRATTGSVRDLGEVDLPGVLAAVQVHDGPPRGAALERVAIIQNHAARTWAVTAAVVHPGIGLTDAADRTRLGRGLADLLDVAARTELIDEVLVLVRTVPDDGAERRLWLDRHRRPGAPALARSVNEDLSAGLARAGVRTEAFVTLVALESRLGREAKESGGGLDGRARVLYALMAEVEAGLRGGMGMTGVSWLTSPELAVATRTGIAPGDRAGIIQALAERERDDGLNADVPWALAGPSGADAVVRHYSHDAWNSVSATVILPAKGAAMGALAPVLACSEPGERRSFLVAYPILRQRTADRQTANAEWAADVAGHLRARAGMRVRAKQRADEATAYGMDAKLARGNCLVRPYAVATVTAPKTAGISDYGRRLDASIRRAGFAPLRLDLAQDVAFAASTVPLGVSLTRRGES